MFFGRVFAMSFKNVSLVALIAIVVCGAFAMPCQAQNTFRRQRGLRWLGQGFGDGYHRQNPGYDTSYYNPYSAHNSRLISQTPEYMAINPVPTNQELPQRFFNGVPFSAYAAPPQVNSGFQTAPTQQYQGSFAPSIGSGVSGLSEDNNDGADSQQQDADEAESNAFGDDDNDFREDQEDSVEFDDDEDMGVEGVDDSEMDSDETDTSDLGGLSGLNDSLSFDFE